MNLSVPLSFKQKKFLSPSTAIKLSLFESIRYCISTAPSPKLKLQSLCILTPVESFSLEFCPASDRRLYLENA